MANESTNAPEPAAAATGDSFRIVAGTYERLLYGIDANLTASPPTLTPTFIYPAHISCIKSLATSQRFLATGSSDEIIKLYDLKQRREVGTLMHHNGTITCLRFFRKTHLLTCSEDGTVAIVRTRDWEVLKTLTGHKRAVSWADIHPTGKVMLSVGKDGTLKCWDLVRGICAYSMRLPKCGDRVLWSPSGTCYAVLMDGGVVQIHTVADGEMMGKIDGAGKVNSIAFCKAVGLEGVEGEVIVTGAEDRTVGVWNVKGECLMRFATGHGNRVKDLDAIVIPSPSSPGKETTVVVTCASDGGIRVWDLPTVQRHVNIADDTTATPSTDSIAPVKKPSFKEATPLASYDAKCRLTCIAIAQPAGLDASQKDADYEMTAGDVAGAASDWESDVEDVPAGQRKKPVVTVSYEGGSGKKEGAKGGKSKHQPNPAGKKRKQNPTDTAAVESGIEGGEKTPGRSEKKAKTGGKGGPQKKQHGPQKHGKGPKPIGNKQKKRKAG
ncbi:hypothetical protein HK104_010950 [Borealophlyctis nickersoniae]|nr:hypothetical protein HK104_010950 [Borealophlyctis nickersoniae]